MSGWGKVEDMREDLLKDWGDLLEKWDGKDRSRPSKLIKLCRKVGGDTAGGLLHSRPSHALFLHVAVQKLCVLRGWILDIAQWSFFFLHMYSGTPPLWTPLGPGEVSCIDRCG